MRHERTHGVRVESWQTVARLAASCVVAVGCGVASSENGTEPQGDDEGAATVSAAATGRYDWLQYNGDPQHSGNNTLETTITRSNVASLTRKFQVTLPSVADGAPVYLASATVSGAVHDALFVTTRDGRIIALDGQTGATLWSKQFGPGTCKINNGSSVCYTTSSPAIDPGRAFVYSYGLDGFVHKLAVADGAETTSGGWPELGSLKPFDEKGSSPLVFATAKSGVTYLYAAHAGYPGDNGDYQGHITVVNLSSGAQQVFNTQCSNQAVHFHETPGTPDCATRQSAVWARAGVVYDPVLDRIFIVTGNANFSPSAHDWGDTILGLSPDGTSSGGNPIDSYTPTNFQQLQDQDADLGSTAPAILPVPSGSTVTRLGLQSGKDARIRLVNLSNLSGAGGPGHTGGEIANIGVPQGGGVLTAPAVWVNPADGATWVFIANGRGISGLKLGLASGGVPQLTTAWQSGNAGFSPLVANGVLYYAGNNVIRALDPTTGATLWSDTTIGGIHWESPVVANGVLYITDGSAHVTAYTVPTSSKFAVKINFQPASSPVPSGYLVDSGAVFGARGNGFSYGWNADNSAQTRDRNASNSPDQRYDTLIHMQKPAVPNATWELAVPSGTYTVRTVSGDPSNIDSVYRINAESTLALSGTPTSTTHWFDQTVSVAVTDGRLTIGNASGSSNNKIDFIEVTQQ